MKRKEVNKEINLKYKEKLRKQNNQKPVEFIKVDVDVSVVITF